MSARLRGTASTFGPWVLAGLLWLASIVTWFEPAPVAVIGTLDATATTVTIGALVALVVRLLRPALKPGERVIRDEEYFQLQEAIVRGVLMARAEADDGGSRARLWSV
jgi:hypothetical protein